MRSLSQEHKDFGVVYTPEELVDYICTTTIYNYLLDKINEKYDKTYSLKSGKLDISRIEPVVQQTILELVSNITILDPAVGLGFFLVSSFRIIEEIHKTLVKVGVQKKSLEEISIEIISNNLYGVDISANSVQTSRKNLIKLVAEKNLALEKEQIDNIIESRVKVGNALIGRDFNKHEAQPIFDNVDLFNWDEEFPDIMKNGGFSLCIGNPPWNILKPLEKEFFSSYNEKISKY